MEADVLVRGRRAHGAVLDGWLQDRYPPKMQAIHIRSVPEEVVTKLKRRAAMHHRSLQGEVLAILEEAASHPHAAAPLPPLVLHLSESTSDAPLSREELYGDDGR